MPSESIPNPGPRAPLDQFLEMSAVLTGFNRVELLGTGMSGIYLNQLIEVVGSGTTGEFLDRFGQVLEKVRAGKGTPERLIGREILGHPRWGPLARNVLTLWYLGNWNQLPGSWRNRWGASAPDQTVVVSAEAYVEGLVWPAMGTHPQGAKAPGFGSWSTAPGPAPT